MDGRSSIDKVFTECSRYVFCNNLLYVNISLKNKNDLIGLNIRRIYIGYKWFYKGTLQFFYMDY